VPALLGDTYRDKTKGTALSQINNQITTLKKDLAAAKTSLDQVTADRDAKQEALASANALAKSAGDRAAAFEKSMGESQKAFDTQIASLQDQLKKLNEQIATTGAARDEAGKSGQMALNDYMNKAEDERRKLVLQLEDSQTQITKLSSEVLDLRQRILNAGGKAEPTVGEADGRVIAVNGVTNEVYISLTSKDRVMPGIPFTIYDPRTGVRFGNDDQALGNGSIEVISVGPSSSICRITRTTKGRAIQTGDLIANLVYHNDRTRKFHFTVFGDFDLDGDGVATAAERDRLVVLIKSWGGEVDDDITSQTDYLVLGEKPKAPLVQESTDTAAADTAPATAPATAAAPGDLPGSITAVRSTDQLHYEELTVAAKRLAIPVLNANRFLAMVGYYNTTVIRY